MGVKKASSKAQKLKIMGCVLGGIALIGAGAGGGYGIFVATRKDQPAGDSALTLTTNISEVKVAASTIIYGTIKPVNFIVNSLCLTGNNANDFSSFSYTSGNTFSVQVNSSTGAGTYKLQVQANGSQELESNEVTITVSDVPPPHYTYHIYGDGTFFYNQTQLIVSQTKDNIPTNDLKIDVSENSYVKIDDDNNLVWKDSSRPNDNSIAVTISGSINNVVQDSFSVTLICNMPAPAAEYKISSSSPYLQFSGTYAVQSATLSTTLNGADVTSSVSYDFSTTTPSNIKLNGNTISIISAATIQFSVNVDCEYGGVVVDTISLTIWPNDVQPTKYLTMSTAGYLQAGNYINGIDVIINCYAGLSSTDITFTTDQDQDNDVVVTKKDDTNYNVKLKSGGSLMAGEDITITAGATAALGVQPVSSIFTIASASNTLFFVTTSTTELTEHIAQDIVLTWHIIGLNGSINYSLVAGQEDNDNWIIPTQDANTGILRRMVDDLSVGAHTVKITATDVNNVIKTFNLTININAQPTLGWDLIQQYFTISNDTITGFATNGDYNLLKECSQSGYSSIQLGSNTVTSIGAEAFRGCASFSTNSIIKYIDASLITSIGTNAFRECANLSFIKLGSVSIGEGAFLDCENLTIPTSGVTFTTSTLSALVFSSPKFTFAMINNISFQTPTAHRVYNDDAFGNHIGIAWVNSASGTGTFVVGGLAFGNLGSYTQYVSSGAIGARAFYGCASVTSIDLGNSTTTIGADAFDRCANTVFQGTPTISAIGVNAFAVCDKLSWNFVNGIPSIGSCVKILNGTAGVAWIPANKTYWMNKAGCLAWGDLGHYSNYVINANVADNAFYGLTSVTGIDLGTTNMIIESQAFAMCKNTIFSGTPTFIQARNPWNDAFMGCEKLSWNFVNGIKGNYGFTKQPNGTAGIAWRPNTKTGTINTAGCLAWGDLGSYTQYVSSGAIGASAFYDCASVQTVNLGTTPINIGKCAFSLCNHMTIQFV